MDVKYKEAETINDFVDAIRLRVDVFILEQGCKPGWEPDKDDKHSKHFIAIKDGAVVATARYREVSKSEIKIERMVTKKEYRNKGVGRGLLQFMIKYIMKQKPRKIILQSQVQARKFYEECGFKTTSKPFDLYGIQHIDMEYIVNSLKKHRKSTLKN